jgi:xanthine dehydrogenase YagS FAD-binding subunit
MRAFANVNARDLAHATGALRQAREQGRSAALAGGGSDLLGLMKERLVTPDLLVNLKTIRGLDKVLPEGKGERIGGLITLDALSRHPLVRERYAVLAEAAESVATPQIRNAATLAGNLCQRPWCWYYRAAFPCFKNGGKTCFAVTGENLFHSIFGGGPSYIVHPSDTAPALVALDASFRIEGPASTRVVSAAEFFALPTADPARENVLGPDEVLAEVLLPPAASGARSTYHKVLDREAWTHAVVSAAVVLEMEGRLCRSARVVLGGVAPVPWRLPNVERLLAGTTITPDLAAQAGGASVAGASPLAKNGYKVDLVKAVVKRALLSLAERA